MPQKKSSTVLVAGLALAILGSNPTFAQKSGIAALKEREKKVKQVVRETMPATVAIMGAEQPASGSGVIINSEGLILTAAHVTAAAGKELMVTFTDGRTVKAKSLGANSSRDAGMAQITDEGEWPHVEMADADDVRLGEWCVALGHPGGYDPNRTPPVRLGRIWTKGFLGMLGSDCTLVGGDSGGPLFNLDGKLIGIHSSIGGQLSENRHVPMDAFERDWDDLLGGRLWGSQGVMMGRVDPDRPAMGVQLDRDSNEGVKVIGLSDPSPAAKAGIEVGDVIRRVGGKRVDEFSDMVGALEKLKVGQKVKIGVDRDGDKLEFEVKLGRLGKLWDADPVPADEADGPAERPVLGVHLRSDAQAAEVFEVLPDSPAERGGIEPGDIVLEIEGEKIRNAAQMVENIGGRAPGERISMLLQRGEDEKEVVVKLGRAG